MTGFCEEDLDLDLDHVALHPQKRGCLLGTGMGGGGGGGEGGRKSEGSTADTARKKTGETVDRRQNNGSVKAVSPRHCAATSALFQLPCWAESQRQCTLHCC